MKNDDRYLWGIDLGGTKIEAVVLDSEKDLKIISRLRLPTKASSGYEHVIAQIQKLIELVKTDTGLTPSKLGIGTPGTLDPYTRLLKNCNSTYLNGKAFKDDLEDALKIPIKMANDANCFAASEANGIIRKELPHAKVIFGVIMGTGVGGGIVVNGEVLHGNQGICGEWGHNFLDASGGMCYCGQSGCVETVISGPALERYYESISNKVLLLKEIVFNYRSGEDKYASMTMNRLFVNFGLAISQVINTLDPDAIVIGGGVGNIDELYTQGVNEVRKHVFNNRLDTKFFKPMFGDSSGVIGAALL
jgi:predicted NBD/HSP70 family sugar kinase